MTDAEKIDAVTRRLTRKFKVGDVVRIVATDDILEGLVGIVKTDIQVLYAVDVAGDLWSFGENELTLEPR